MAKLNKTELLSLIEWTDNDLKAEIYIPNDIFGMLAKNDELNKTHGTRRSTHVSEAYCYLVLATYLYRNCKYNIMEDVSMKALQQIIGFNYEYKKFNYVIKKDGVLDKMGLTNTISLKDAPIMYEMGSDFHEGYSYFKRDGHVNFITQEEYDERNLEDSDVEILKQLGIRKSVKNAKVKEPTFALYNEENEYGQGTFFGFADSNNVANTHKVDLKVFIECMTNENLGCTAFYLYSFLQWKCQTTQGKRGRIEIGLDTIMYSTGVLRGGRDKALHGLKAHGLINCIPAPFIVGATEGEGSNIYSINGIEEYTQQENKYSIRALIPVKSIEVKAEIEKKRKEVKYGDIERYIEEGKQRK